MHSIHLTCPKEVKQKTGHWSTQYADFVIEYVSAFVVQSN